MEENKSEYMPIGKRTRLQTSLRYKELIDRNKRARLAARNKHRETYGKKNKQNGVDVSDDEDVKVVDEAEYLRRMAMYGCQEDSSSVSGDYWENSDDSVQFVAEKWNPLGVGIDDDEEDQLSTGMKRSPEAKVNVGGSSKLGEGCDQSSGLHTVSENDGSGRGSDDDDDDDDDGEEELSDEDFEVNEARMCTNLSPMHSSFDDSKEAGEGKRKISNYADEKVVRANVSQKKTQENTPDEENQSGVEVVDDKYLQWLVKSGEHGRNNNEGESKEFSSSENGSFSQSSSLPSSSENSVKSINPKRGSLPVNRNAEIKNEPENVYKPENCGNFESVGKRKRGRPPNIINKAVNNSTPQTKKRIRKFKTHEAENIMLNKILDNVHAGLGSCIPSDAVTPVSETITTLPLKFRLGVQSSMPVNSEEVQDSEQLFQDLGFALRACDIGAEASFADENDDDDDVHGDNAVAQAKLCLEGKHYLIHDDEIGVRCKYCFFLKLEIRHVTPAFNTNPFGIRENRNYGRVPCDNANASNGDFHLPEFNDDQQNACSNNVQGTVWELIRGVKETLYPHQQEGFEFIWRNIGGGIKFDELGKPSKFGSGGCLICHAPGTGKTRLAITFLQSFIRKYPMSKPVIIAPRSMLLTWEEEFARWNIDVPFINLNKSELSGNEVCDVIKHAENVKSVKTVRIAKLYTWAMGKGILGITYTLFEQLAGDRKGVDEKIKRTLLEQPGILILDEGHIARNDQSYIWNVLTEVRTKRKIILSGTPFQNNFEELLNTISLVREEFGFHLPDKYIKHNRNTTEKTRGLMESNVHNDNRIAKLRDKMKPFVHVHKGEILKKTLRGLFHSVLLLKPSDLQKICFQQLKVLKSCLKLDNLISIASVHPFLLYSCEEIPASVKVLLKEHRKNLDDGVKIKFLFDLIKLAEGEKVLVFAQFLKPLKFIGNLLKSHFCWTEEKEWLYMDGKQDVKQKQAIIKHFNDPKSEARVLLASTKACCEGIHLVGASRVVLLDVVWNPSVERQAISRAYRLGQKKDVFVYHLITSGTLEEDKYERQVTKDRVSRKVFSSEEEIEHNVRMPERISEDRILEEMIQSEKIKNMFVNIIYQPKADEMINSFGPVNL